MRPHQGQQQQRRPRRTSGYEGGGEHGGRRHGNGGSNGGRSSHAPAQQGYQGQNRSAANLRNHIFDSNSPGGSRVRGNAEQLYQKYHALAADALAGDDRVLAENYRQHAEHYYRITEAINEAALAEARARQSYEAQPTTPHPAASPQAPQQQDGFYAPPPQPELQAAGQAAMPPASGYAGRQARYAQRQPHNNPPPHYQAQRTNAAHPMQPPAAQPLPAQKMPPHQGGQPGNAAASDSFFAKEAREEGGAPEESTGLGRR